MGQQWAVKRTRPGRKPHLHLQVHLHGKSSDLPHCRGVSGSGGGTALEAGLLWTGYERGTEDIFRGISLSSHCVCTLPRQHLLRTREELLGFQVLALQLGHHLQQSLCERSTQAGCLCPLRIHVLMCCPEGGPLGGGYNTVVTAPRSGVRALSKGAPSPLTLFLLCEDARGGEPSHKPDGAGTLIRMDFWPLDHEKSLPLTSRPPGLRCFATAAQVDEQEK